MPKEENEKEYGLEGESWQEGGFRFVLFCPSCAKELLATATSALHPRGLYPVTWATSSPLAE